VSTGGGAGRRRLGARLAAGPRAPPPSSRGGEEGGVAELEQGRRSRRGGGARGRAEEIDAARGVAPLREQGGAAWLRGAGEGDCRSRKEQERVVGRPPLLPPPRVAAAGRAPAHAGPPASAHRRRYGCGACPPAHAAARSRLARNGTARPPAPPREEGRGAPRGEDGRMVRGSRKRECRGGSSQGRELRCRSPR